MTETKILLLCFGLFIFSQNTIGQKQQSQTKIEYKNKGALYQLTIWKSAVEAIMGREPDNKEIQNDYLQLKAELDAAVNQFEYDMNRRNRLWKKFDVINEAFKNGKQTTQEYPSRIAGFAKEINQYIQNCQAFVTKYSGIEAIDGGSIDPLAVIGQGWTIYKDLKDIQGTKVEGLKNLLDSIKLSSPEEIGKEDKGKKDKS